MARAFYARKLDCKIKYCVSVGDYFHSVNVEQSMEYIDIEEQLHRYWIFRMSYCRNEGIKRFLMAKFFIIASATNFRSVCFDSAKEVLISDELLDKMQW